MALVRLVAIRTGIGVATLLAVSALIFLGTEALPGDAAQAALGQSATPEAVAAYRKQFGLDKPLLQRYGSWLGGLLRGDLGKALPTEVPVASVIGDNLRNTAMLAAITMGLLVPIATSLGIVSALRPGRWLDQTVAGLTLVAISTPGFVIASFLVVIFAVSLRWLPPVSLVDPTRPLLSHSTIFVLPVATLLMESLGQTIRMIRASMIDVLQAPYIEMARLKGVPERRLLVRHALPNALGPTLQILAFNIPWLVGGVVIVESVFNYRGVGTALVDAVAARDLPTVEAIGMIIAAVIIGANLMADLAAIAMNPRLRRGG